MLQEHNSGSPTTKRLHPIVDEPWRYEITSLHYENNLADPQNTYLDLTLQRGDVIRRLRFLAPQGLEIEKGFPTATRGIVILDVAHQGMENISVRVEDFEASGGAVKFWAKAVIDLERIDPSHQAGTDGSCPNL